MREGSRRSNGNVEEVASSPADNASDFIRLAAAKALRKAPLQVILIDRADHRLRLPRGVFFLTTGTCVTHFS
jgi:hypothetical protein